MTDFNSYAHSAVERGLYDRKVWASSLLDCVLRKHKMPLWPCECLEHPELLVSTTREWHMGQLDCSPPQSPQPPEGWTRPLRAATPDIGLTTAQSPSSSGDSHQNQPPQSHPSYMCDPSRAPSRVCYYLHQHLGSRASASMYMQNLKCSYHKMLLKIHMCSNKYCQVLIPRAYHHYHTSFLGI